MSGAGEWSEVELRTSLTPPSTPTPTPQSSTSIMQGLQQAENMIRAGLERARYNVLQRTQRRSREPEAANVHMRDGTVFASSSDGTIEVTPPAPRLPPGQAALGADRCVEGGIRENGGGWGDGGEVELARQPPPWRLSLTRRAGVRSRGLFGSIATLRKYPGAAG